MAGNDYKILGVDPGTNVLGYGVIHIKDKQCALTDLGVLRLGKLDTHYDKLREIYHSIQDLIEKYQPAHLAIEAPFFGKNVQSMLKLGRAQGVVMAAGITMDVPITEYAPKKIKMAVTGNGNASKEQVSAMLCSIFKIKIPASNLDATDALATALCHHYQRFSTTSKSNNWSSFIKNNPGRLNA
ncbi:UNVERIFIED_CONTAM: hypothetical protein GTU68_060835 [Idotea baltica]|nr:hypothetical protein [Idotea baltica]